MEPAWTIRRVLDWTSKDFAGIGIDSPRLDAEILIAQALGLSRVALYMDLDRPLDDEERTKVRALIKRRRAREPIAYIVGAKEFYGRSFSVDGAVLIPRPDTEALVERALEILTPDAPAKVLDLCTGSGAIGITLAAERPELRVDLTDVSQEALTVARANAERLGVAERAQFFLGDLFACVPREARYGLIACNPPYVPSGERERLSPEIRDHEPGTALFGGADGMEIIRRLIAQAPGFLEPGGVLLIEVGAGQAAAVEETLRADGRYVSFARHRDLGKIERVVEARAA